MLELVIAVGAVYGTGDWISAVRARRIIFEAWFAGISG